MLEISDFMTEHHKFCDDLFIQGESAVEKEQWDEASKKWYLFADELEKHFQREETILFPEFETLTGMTQGPTEMMRIEHQQIREIVKEISKSCENKDKINYLGLAETLMVTMQQHNMKEEQILYPMIENTILNKDEIINDMIAMSPLGTNSD
ncbi:MAG: hemerythrin domain-containing protein [Pseudomonadota bacterium]